MLSSETLRGHMEAILLRLVYESDRYGYELFSEIGQRTGERLQIKEATLYAVLQRLEKQGLMTSYQGNISGGSKRRYYHITPAGRAFLYKAMEDWQGIKEIIDVFLEGKLS